MFTPADFRQLAALIRATCRPRGQEQEAELAAWVVRLDRCAAG